MTEAVNNPGDTAAQPPVVPQQESSAPTVDSVDPTTNTVPGEDARTDTTSSPQGETVGTLLDRALELARLQGASPDKIQQLILGIAGLAMPAGTVSPSPAELHAPSGQPAAAQPEAKRPQLSKGEIDQRDENDKFLATGHPVMVEYHYKDGDFVPATNAGGPKIGTETRPVVVDKTLNAIKDTTHEVVRVQAARNMAGEFIDFDDKVGGPKLSRKERGLREGAAWKLTYIAANADPNARNQVVTTMLFPYSEMERVLDIVETDPRAFRRLTEATIADAKDSTTRERRLLSHAAERFDEWDAQGGDSTLQLREGEGKSLTRRDISVPSH